MRDLLFSREKKKSTVPPCWRQNRPSSPPVLRAHVPRAMAVDVEAARRFAPGKKERDKPAKAKSGLGKTKGDAPSGKQKAAPSTRDAKASRSSSADPRRAPQKPARGGGKPPRPPRDAKKGVEDASARRASTPPLGVTPNELVAGLAGSLAMCVVSGVSKLVRRKLGGRASKKDLSAEERARLDAVKAELREALAQLREQRNSLDHLRKQNKEIARENQLLKVAAANAAAAKRRESSVAASSRGGFVTFEGTDSPSGPLSRAPSPGSSAPASPELETDRGVVSNATQTRTRQSEHTTSNGEELTRGGLLARLLDPLPANADDATRASREIVSRVLRGVLSLRESSSSRSDADMAESLSVTQVVQASTTDPFETHVEMFASEEDAWAGVPRGSPGAGSEYDDALSARSAASGFSGISDLSTVSAAEALLSRMRTKHVLMARIKNHR
jgi:hypothetical protein